MEVAKRHFGIISLFVMMLAVMVIPVTGFAEMVDYKDSQGVCYILDTSTGTAEVSSYEGEPVTVTIPEEIKNADVTYSVTGIATKAFASCRSLESVVLPDSVTTIKLGAFRECTNLRYVKLSNNLTVIPTSCFYGDIDLTAITIPDKVTRIDSWAFCGCSLVNVTLPENVEFIGTSSFENNRILRTITLPDSLTGIGMDAFKGCRALESVTLPENCDSTGSGVFEGCTSLTTIPLSDSFTKISNRYCWGCTALTVVTIPENITEIGELTFKGCTGLEIIYIPSGTEIKESVLAASGPTIPATTTQVKYTVDGSGNITITEITVGSGKNSFKMPTEIAGHPVTSVNIGEHTHISADANCSQRANCDLCGEEFLGDHQVKYSSSAAGHWHVCSVCNLEMDALAEHIENGVITTPATTEKEGVKTYTCTVCGYQRTETIPKVTDTPDPDTQPEQGTEAPDPGTQPEQGTQTPNPDKTPEQGTQSLPVKVTKLTIKAPSKKLAVGKKVQLTVTVSPNNADNKAVTWKTSNKKYATVNAKGKVTLKKAGVGKTVTITAIAKDGSGKKATIKIKIMKHAVKSIKLKAPSKTLKAGKSMTLKTTIKTTGKKVNKTLSFTSSNTKYATVNKKGKVTVKKAGKGKTVTITAKATDGSGKKAKVKIKIK